MRVHQKVAATLGTLGLAALTTSRAAALPPALLSDGKSRLELTLEADFVMPMSTDLKPYGGAVSATAMVLGFLGPRLSLQTVSGAEMFSWGTRLQFLESDFGHGQTLHLGLDVDVFHGNGHTGAAALGRIAFSYDPYPRPNDPRNYWGVALSAGWSELPMGPHNPNDAVPFAGIFKMGVFYMFDAGYRPPVQFY